MQIEKDENGNFLSLYLEDKKISLSLLKKPQTRRMMLRFSPDRERLFITIPSYLKKNALIEDFLNSSRLWIWKKISFKQEEISIKNESQIILFGQAYGIEIRRSFKNEIKKEKEKISVQIRHERYLNKVWETFFKQEALEFFTFTCAQYATYIKIFPTDIKIRDFKSRWGSCAHTGVLSFSWRLAFAPLSVAQYVAAHEVAHLKVPNHSTTFWKLVEKLYPSYIENRTWLKKRGSILFRIRV